MLGKASLVSSVCVGRQCMKLEELCHRVVTRTIELLEQKYHYKIADDTRKEILEQVRRELDSLIEG
jgi:hypothetical protein